MASFFKKASRGAFFRRFTAYAIYAYLRIVFAIARGENTFPPDVASVLRGNRPALALIWHGRMVMPLRFASEGGRISMVASKHGDGALVAEVMRRFGYDPIAGSSSSGGAVALRGMYEKWANGGVIVVTPDGPRGPARTLKGKSVDVALKAGATILPMGGAARPAFHAGSWDEFCLPYPFAKLSVRCGRPIDPARFSAQDVTSLKKQLEREMTRLETIAECDVRPTALWEAAYALAGQALRPFLLDVLRRRVARGKEDPARLCERRGVATLSRPAGEVVWIHAASVGESISALPFLEALRRARPHASIVVTTVTRSSADLLKTRLPDYAFHQYMPPDVPSWIERFLRHWRPDALFVLESELWPTTLRLASRRCPVILLNGRLSDKSYAEWRRFPFAARSVTGRFTRVYVQERRYAGRFAELGARDVRHIGNLKHAAPPLPCDAEELRRVVSATKGRTAWLAASIHPGEEGAVLVAHEALKKEFPDLLTVIAPRHPDFGKKLAENACSAYKARLRSCGELPDGECEIYVADTIGEMGIFYRAVSLAFIGGSLIPHGGQNPMEAARLGCGVIVGPHTENFSDAVEALRDADAVIAVKDARALAEALRAALNNPEGAERRANRALAVANAQEGEAERHVEDCADILPVIFEGSAPG
ncbi:MAG: glycosyltransferase N-terminal domain-containing protein [Rickettsiales bacterium]